MTASEFTHLDPLGRARMVDVTAKDATHRRAVARCRVYMESETAARIASGAITKGDVLAEAHVEVEAQVDTVDRTGVEMEALTACAVAALNIYDMCKSLDRGMTIGDLQLWEKTGGRSGTFRRPGADGLDLD